MGLLDNENYKWVIEEFEGAVLFDGFEDCLIGFGTQGHLRLAIYSYNKIARKLATEFRLACKGHDDASCPDDHDLEAEEFIEFNTAGAWFGDNTPVMLRVADEEYTCLK